MLTDADINWGWQPNDGTADATTEPIAETFSAFCERLNNRETPKDIIPSLVPGRGTIMPHGQPRALKTWINMEMARAITTEDAAFGLERFRVASAVPTWYLTEEDPELDVRDRFSWLFQGRQQEPGSDLLHVSVHRTINLDDPLCQARMLHYAKQVGIRVTIADPIRSMSAAVDQGPREIKPLIQFLRYYMRETGSIVILGHHDAKPTNGKPDDRARPQRASGGAIFSAADAPIHVELVGTSGTRTLVSPSHYKFSATPDPFVVTLETDDPKRPTWARLQGKDCTADDAGELVLHQKIRDYVLEHPGTSGSRVAAGVRADKSRVLAALDRMFNAGEADYYQKGQTKHWTMAAGTDGKNQ